jgi:hypothetical protein
MWALTRGGFAAYLRGLGFSAFTVEHYLRRLMCVGCSVTLARQTELRNKIPASRFPWGLALITTFSNVSLSN